MGDDEIPQELVAGKYRLTRLLGRGGMGSVWEGVHSTLGTRVACKFIESEYADSAEARSRFENEARAAASLRSKHVVEVHDHGVTNDGRPYIVMEFLAGEPLDSRLSRVGRLSMPDTAQVVTHVARALAKAHEAGIVHRDLKPENVFLVRDEEDNADIAKVVDFGIAKFTDKSVGISSSTRTGSVLGTPYYMSPEQARGLRSVDYRSDLWSLGVIAFRCVVGRLPFEGEALGDLLVKLCTAPIPIPSQLLPGVPHEFDVWMARALSREPESRFPDARSMAQELSMIAGVSQRARLSSYDAEISGQMAALGMAAPQRFSSSSGGATPLPMAHGTPYPQSAAGIPPALAAGSTNGALTATPPLEMRKSKAPVFAALGAGIVVLGIGVAVLAQSFSGESLEPATSASVVEPIADEAPVAAAPAVEPVTDVLVEQDADAVEPIPSAEKPPAVAVRRSPGPAKKPRPVPKKVDVPAPPPEPAEAKPVEPAPPPPPKRVAPRPRAATPKKPGIDVGY